jgi:hypothetical protein
VLFQMLHVIAITLVTFAVAPAVAHALELPGKVRLPKEAHVTVQQIYYPGFTTAGVGEFAAFIAVRSCFGPLRVAPWLSGSHSAPCSEFSPCKLSIGSRFTHSTILAAGRNLGAADSRFFSFDPSRRQQDRSRQPYDWTRLRDRWERSHLVRAMLALVSLVLVAAVNT